MRRLLIFVIGILLGIIVANVWIYFDNRRGNRDLRKLVRAAKRLGKSGTNASKAGKTLRKILTKNETSNRQK